MKRRVLIAKALAHEPRILFLDEPTAGVDVELRKDMWQLVRALRASGVTIILTTHYIEEAEEMADRVGVINKGELILVEDKAELMRKLGKKQMTLELRRAACRHPARTRRLRADAGEWRQGADLYLRHQGGAHRHHGAARRTPTGRHPVQGFADHAKLAGRHLRRPGEAGTMNSLSISMPSAPSTRIEMARTRRTLLQSIVSPVISTSLYFVVFGSAIGSRITQIEGVNYGAFIVPGLIMLMLLTQSIDERLVRHLFSAFRRHDLRVAVRAGVGARNRARLCGRRGDQVDHPRRSSSWRRPGCSCRSASCTRSGWWGSWC